MRRREFLSSLCLTLAGTVLEAAAQTQRLPVIGLLSSAALEPNRELLSTFLQGLREAGFVQDQNVRIEFRWADGNYDKLPSLAAELVRQNVDVLVAFDNTATALAAKAATSSIPVLFAIGTDPVKFGLVQSLNRPGGNVTGIVNLTVGLGVKRLEVMRDLLPRGSNVGLLVNPRNPATEAEAKDVQTAADAGGQFLLMLRAGTADEIDAAFAAAADKRLGGLLVQSEPFLTSRHNQIAALAAQTSLPTIAAYREFAKAGGLMSYGASLTEQERLLGRYVGRVLKGDRPADLPVQQSTKIELVINLKTAKALGIEVPPMLLARADKVIE